MIVKKLTSICLTILFIPEILILSMAKYLFNNVEITSQIISFFNYH